MKKKNFKNLKGLTVEELENYFHSKGIITKSTFDVISIIHPIQEFWGVTAPIVLAQIALVDGEPNLSVQLNVTTPQEFELLLMNILEMFIEDASK